MCGIAGVTGGWDRGGQRVAGMLSRLSHRGPDEERVELCKGAALGVRRLAILDVLRGHQPMRDETGTVVAAQNGEIYNYRDLRRDLASRGHRFETDNDTEVLPHLYEEYGDDFPRHLRGMFAIAIWDEREQSLLLVRDRVGKKPLFFSRSPSGIAFASEIQALLTLPLSREIDDQAIREYLSFGYVRAPRSAFRAITKVRPGQIVKFTSDGMTERAYWKLTFQPKETLSEADALAGLKNHLSAAVRLRLISDVPLGAFLSGGLDSSAVVATMAQESSTPVRTYSVGFREEDFSELRYARAVAQRFGTDHHEYIVEPDAMEALPTLVRHLGEPFADASIVPTYYVAKTARQDVTVALNGDGGDEVFAGYDRYRAALAADRIRFIPRSVRGAVAALARAIPEGGLPRRSRRARRLALTLGMSRLDRYGRWTGFFFDDPAIMGERLRKLPISSSWTQEPLDEAEPTDRLEEMLAIDMRNYLPGDLLVKMDIATMANSLEGRSPLLDHELIEYVSRLPSNLKLRDGRSKYLLRKLMTGILPDEVLQRRKMGFGAPVGHWLRGPLRQLVEDTVMNAPDRGYVDHAVARRVVERHLALEESNGLHVWCLLMLELWFRQFVDSSQTIAA